MSAKVYSCAIIGLDSCLVEIESDSLRSGQPGFTIVGLPDTAISEARERVRSAIKNSGLAFPRGRAIVNLAPANIKKQGPAFDLGIAISLILHTGQIDFKTKQKMFVGELALDGSLRPINGVLPMALAAKDSKLLELFVPEANAPEASLVKGLEIRPVKNLAQLVEHLSGSSEIKAFQGDGLRAQEAETEDVYDFADIKGQENAKRALEIAASGGHNILMSGPPGSGKTLLARVFASILPDMTFEESLEATKIHSVAGVLSGNTKLITIRPFRSPHHTSSGAALVGGGAWPKPGEISLAHRGVLFLDEFTEFSKSVLENLRQPLEDGVVTVSRVQGSLTFPANFTLVAAMNPCPCGYATDQEQECRCGANEIWRYQSKISGPILDRIDLHVEVSRVKYDKLTSTKISENSKTIRDRVQAARARQTERFKKTRFSSNSDMSPAMIKEFCKLPADASNLIAQAIRQLKLSVRSYHRILKISRTIADLDGQEDIAMIHLSEALNYRPKLEG